MKSNLKANLKSGAVNVAVIVILVLLVGGVVAYFLTDGFGKKEADNQNRESQPSQESEENNQQANSAEGKNTQLPDWIRDNYPIYPDSTISSVTEQSVAGANERYIIGTTAKGDGAEIANWYHEEYEKTGWTYDNVNTDKRFNASKSVDGSDLSVVIGVNTTSVGSIVTITAQRIVR